MLSTANGTASGPSGARSVSFVCLVWLALFAVRMTGPSDIICKDQLKPAAYALDCIQNGKWIIQHDSVGGVASKPPLYTWAVAAVTLAQGRINRFAMYLPSALATLGIALMLLQAGRRYFGATEGLMGALVFLLSRVTVKQMGFGRPDALFVAMTVLAALLAFRAWRSGRGWVRFWLAASLATLAKGPLGALLAAGGLLASLWERRAGKTIAVRAFLWPGLLLFVLIGAGWLALAYWELGRAVLDKLINEQLVGHAMRSPEGKVPGQVFYKQSLYFLSYFAPWSLFACVGFLRVLRRPSPNDEGRCFERFLSCWFFVGLPIFSIATHQQADHLGTILPAAALLAGREVAFLLARLRPATAAKITAAVSALVVVVFVLVYHVFVDKVAASPVVLKKTRGLERLAGEIRNQVGDGFPMTFCDTDFGLQFHLNVLRPPVTRADAAALLRGEAAAFVAVRDVSRLREQLDSASPVFEVAAFISPDDRSVTIMGNRPRMEWSDRLATQVGPILVQMEKSRGFWLSGGWFVMDLAPGGSVAFTNRSDEPQEVRAQVRAGRRALRTLAPGETWRMTD